MRERFFFLFAALVIVLLPGCGKPEPAVAPALSAADWMVKGQACFERLEYAEAIAAYQKALQANPPSGPNYIDGTDANLRYRIACNYNALGGVLHTAARYAEARPYYEQALQYDPTMQAAKNNLRWAKAAMAEAAARAVQQHTCMKCEGTGQCKTCKGTGKSYTRNSMGNYADCEDCHGTRLCPLCNGKGWRPGPPDPWLETS